MNANECHYKIIYNESKYLMEELDIDIKIPRLSGQQKSRSNPPNVNSCEQF